MPTSTVTAFRNNRRRGRRSRPRRPEPYRLGNLIAAYLACLLVVIGSFLLAGPLGIFVYFICGAWLTRFLSHRVLWWPFASNIENVYLAKVSTFLRWPIAVPAFLWKLAVVKVL